MSGNETENFAVGERQFNAYQIGSPHSDPSRFVSRRGRVRSWRFRAWLGDLQLATSLPVANSELDGGTLGSWHRENHSGNCGNHAVSRRVLPALWPGCTIAKQHALQQNSFAEFHRASCALRKLLKFIKTLDPELSRIGLRLSGLPRAAWSLPEPYFTGPNSLVQTRCAAFPDANEEFK